MSCPGIEIEPGVTSGCGGGIDCPVCGGGAPWLVQVHYRLHCLAVGLVDRLLAWLELWSWS